MSATESDTDPADPHFLHYDAPLEDQLCQRWFRRPYRTYLLDRYFTLVGSYLKLAVNEYRQANSTFLYNALINVAEAGAEDAMWALKSDDWTGWTDGGTFVIRQETGLNLSNTATGQLTVMIDVSGAFPTIYVEASAQLRDNRTISKQIKMQLTGRSLFANGLTAKDELEVNGGSSTIDSYDSAAGAHHPITNRGDEARVGTVSIDFEDLDAGNSDIFGYVATGGGTPVFGPNAKVYGSGWNPGDPNIDPTRVTLDFTADLPDVDPPTMSAGALGNGDADIAYLTESGEPGSRTISGGLPDAPIEYHLTEFDMNNNREMIVDGHILMRVDGEVDISELSITAGSSVTLFVAGDFTVSGNGYANDNPHAETFVVYGTGTNATDFTLNGSAGLIAAVYAPNSDIIINGGGSGPGFSGAAVGDDIALNGGVVFHYDEALENFGSGDPNYKLKYWHELIKNSNRVDFAYYLAAAQNYSP